MAPPRAPYFLIPARRGSRGLPLKNRHLFDLTAQTIPDQFRDRVFVSTDDEFIQDQAKAYRFNIVLRPPGLARDETSMRDVLKHFISTCKICDDSIVVVLYLTYPERKWRDIKKIFEFFLASGKDSLICAENVTEHPYLCFKDLGNGKASQLISHDYFRRQDYPLCIRQSMFVSCYKGKAVDHLSDLMVAPETYFFKLTDRKVDIDSEEDLDEYRSR